MAMLNNQMVGSWVKMRGYHMVKMYPEKSNMVFWKITINRSLYFVDMFYLDENLWGIFQLAMFHYRRLPLNVKIDVAPGFSV